MDHEELIKEFPSIEKLTPAERIQLARERRALQLLKQTERERDEKAPAPRRPRLRFKPEIALLEATARGDIKEVERLLTEEAADPNSHNEDGLTPLHQCAIDDNGELLELLLRGGANVDAQDTEQWTPLHAAACCAHMDICRALIAHNANLLAVNADGNMPYDICEDDATLDLIETEMANRNITQLDIDDERGLPERAMLDDMKLVHQRNAPLDQRYDDGATPLHVAAAHGYYDVAAFLLRCGVAPTVRDNDLWQPIHAAACWAQPDLIELLCEYGADVIAKTSAGETPLELCEDVQTRAVIVTLQQEAAKRKRLAFGARDSRRQSRKKKSHSKFESPEPQTSPLSDSLLSARGAIKRLSLRDKSGMTPARLEARNEHRDLIRSYSKEDISKDTKKDKDEDAPVSTENIKLHAAGRHPSTKSPKKGSMKTKGMSPDEWLRKLEAESDDVGDATTAAVGKEPKRSSKKEKKQKKKDSQNNGALVATTTNGGGGENDADDRCSVTTDAPRAVFKNPKTDVVGPQPASRKLGRCGSCCVIS